MTKRVELGGRWRFKGIDAYRRLPAGKRRCLQWMDAMIPGTVHTDLVANRLLPDPSYRMNENEVQWVDELQWVYRKTFVMPAAMLGSHKIILVAEGLDTYASIRCNGREVGHTENMFVSHRFDVTDRVHAGKNEIEVRFDSATFRARREEEKYGRLEVSHGHHRVYVRKAQYSFGWDWGPTLATCGIWRPISLQAYSFGRMSEPAIRVLKVGKKGAVVEVSVGIERLRAGALRLNTAIVGGSTVIEDGRACSGRKVRFRLLIKEPRLWWPNGSGDQPMYAAYFSLRRNGEEIDRLSLSFALRTVRLIQKKDANGASFVFEVNGVQIYCKGADWIPADNFIPRISDATYAGLLRMARTAHMNMLRVWGGGIYEEDIFYDLCDRLGLMVWQDFMYACGEYPDHPAFLREARREAEEAVRRLRHHPSIVLWCGNNECEWLFCTKHPDKRPDDMGGALIFSRILPEVCAREDGTRPYWRSSPFGEGFPNAEGSGNHHQWTVWSSWQDYRAYESDRGRFVTEFGFQSPANVPTFEAVTLPQDRVPQSEVMEHHNKQIEGTERLMRFQAAHYRLGSTWERFIYLGQLVQAEALKCAVEHWRRRKFDTAGSLFWQLNDCWPVSSWSVIDSSLRPKAAYYFAKRFFAPLLVSMRRANGGIEVWITNDKLHAVKGTLELSWKSFSGKRSSKVRRSVSIRTNKSARVLTVSGAILSRFDPHRWYLHGVLKIDGVVVSENRFFLLEPKHLELGSPDIRFTLRELERGVYRMTLKAGRFAKSVYAHVEGEDVVWEDNYFDVDAGSVKVLEFRSAGNLAELRKRVRIEWV